MTDTNTTEVISVDSPLSNDEQKLLFSLEQVLRDGFEKMEDMSNALLQIRAKKLYRAKFRTFEDYVRVEWDMAISRAYQICKFGTVIQNLRLHNCGETPQNEAQTRELSKLEPETQVEVWQETVRGAGTKPTAAAIRKVAEKRKSAVIDIEATVSETETRPCRDLKKAAEVFCKKAFLPFIKDFDEGDRQELKERILCGISGTPNKQPTHRSAPAGPDYFQIRGQLTDLWESADRDNRRQFLISIFGERSNRAVKTAIERVCKKKSPGASGAVTKKPKVTNA